MLVLTRKEGQSIMLVDNDRLSWVLTVKSINPTPHTERVSFIICDPNPPPTFREIRSEELYKIGEQFEIAEHIVARIVAIESRGASPPRVRLGFSAPDSIRIFREEIWDKIKLKYE